MQTAIALLPEKQKAVFGEVSKKYEIVDGQQRLSALRDFAKSKFPLLPVSADSKLRIPKAESAQPRRIAIQVP